MPERKILSRNGLLARLVARSSCETKPWIVGFSGRIGDTKEALELIIKELKDMQQATTFCQEHDDPDLWNDLINHSLDKPGCFLFAIQMFRFLMFFFLCLYLVAQNSSRSCCKASARTSIRPFWCRRLKMACPFRAWRIL